MKNLARNYSLELRQIDLDINRTFRNNYAYKKRYCQRYLIRAAFKNIISNKFSIKNKIFNFIFFIIFYFIFLKFIKKGKGNYTMF